MLTNRNGHASSLSRVSREVVRAVYRNGIQEALKGNQAGTGILIGGGKGAFLLEPWYTVQMNEGQQLLREVAGSYADPTIFNPKFMSELGDVVLRREYTSPMLGAKMVGIDGFLLVDEDSGRVFGLERRVAGVPDEVPADRYLDHLRGRGGTRHSAAAYASTLRSPAEDPVTAVVLSAADAVTLFEHGWPVEAWTKLGVYQTAAADPDFLSRNPRPEPAEFWGEPRKVEYAEFAVA